MAPTNIQTRPAVASDAEAIKRFGIEFLGEAADVSKLEHRMTDPNIVTYVSDEAYCEVKIYPQSREVRVTSLLPRGIDRDKLRPLLAAALKEVLVRQPEAKKWRVWAWFWKAVDADGSPDGGESECKVWQTEWVGSKAYQLADGRWVVESTMEEVT